MRNSILVTTAIALIAGVAALALSQSGTFRNLLGTAEGTATTIRAEQTAQQSASTAETASTTAQPTVENTVSTAMAETVETVETATAETQAAPETEIMGYTPAPSLAGDSDVETLASSQQLNDQTPSAGSDGEQAATEGFTVDVAYAMKDRFVGKEDAPIVVEDYSSLTCPHCAFFHNTIYPKLKENYIDTGKVRWVFKGFPLNEPALRAEMVARCAPGDKYIQLTEYMYENQPKWAFEPDPLGTLNVMLRVAGVTNDVFNACAMNSELETAIAGRLEEVAEKHNINSTPTFVVDGKKTIAGAGTYVGFAYDLDRILREKGLYEEPKAPEYSTDAAVPPAAGDAAQ